jgi:hypothetical protein
MSVLEMFKDEMMAYYEKPAWLLDVLTEKTSDKLWAHMVAKVKKEKTNGQNSWTEELPKFHEEFKSPRGKETEKEIQERKFETCRSMIMGWMYWASTQEGHDFWDEIHTKMIQRKKEEEK